jgi:hypothetical protein
MEIEETDISTKGYEFYWNVAGNGYEIADKTEYRCATPDPPGPIAEYYPERIFFFNESLRIETKPPWLIAKRIQDFTPPQAYRPLSDTVLHRKFAGLKTENLEMEVLSFARKYGMLGRTVQLHPLIPAPVEIGESLRCWQREINKMGVILAIWDLVRREDAGKLGQIILWPYPDTVVVRFKWKIKNGRYEILPWDDDKSDGYCAEALLATLGEPAAFFERHNVGDILGPARHYVSSILNHHLDGVTPRLVADLGYKVAFMPNSLLDALWLMFMLEVDGTTRTCWQCDKPFEPTRKNNIYCSKACKRMAFYYSNARIGNT